MSFSLPPNIEAYLRAQCALRDGLFQDAMNHEIAAHKLLGAGHDATDESGRAMVAKAKYWDKVKDVERIEKLMPLQGAICDAARLARLTRVPVEAFAVQSTHTVPLDDALAMLHALKSGLYLMVYSLDSDGTSLIVNCCYGVPHSAQGMTPGIVGFSDTGSEVVTDPAFRFVFTRA